MTSQWHYVSLWVNIPIDIPIAFNASIWHTCKSKFRGQACIWMIEVASEPNNQESPFNFKLIQGVFTLVVPVLCFDSGNYIMFVFTFVDATFTSGPKLVNKHHGQANCSIVSPMFDSIPSDFCALGLQHTVPQGQSLQGLIKINRSSPVPKLLS